MKKEEMTYKFREMLRRSLVGCWLAAVVILLAACQSDEVSSAPDNADTPEPLSFVVSEEPWQQSQVNITRSDASMLEELKAASLGFGIFCGNTWFKAGNIQMTWSNTTQAWGNNTYLWPYDVTSSNFGGAFNVYAYAPYNSSYNSTSVPSDGSAVLLTFSSPLSNTTDLLWAKGERQAAPNNYTVSMQFQHALSKLSFGTITNTSGHSVELKSVKMAGTLYSSRKLSLGNGEWSAEGAVSAATEVTRTIDTDTEADGNQPLAIADGETKNIDVDGLLQIPGPTLTVTLSLTYDGDDLTAAFDVPLTQEAHTTVNITIKNNFEVVIE